MADISTYSIEELEKYLSAKKTVAAVEGKPAKTTVKPAQPVQPATPKPKRKLTKAQKEHLSKIASARWAKVRKAGGSKLVKQKTKGK
jgi:hypothetical protein